MKLTTNLPEYPHRMIERAMAYPGEIETDSGVFIACVNDIDGHTDEHFAPWSAFLTLRNDGCRVWQRGGYRGIPKVGERFTLNIHKLHGVISPRCRGMHAIVLVYADGRTERGAIRKLAASIRAARDVA